MHRFPPFMSGIFLLGALAAAFSAIILYKMPSIVREKAESILKTSGFTIYELPTATPVFGSGIQYKNIRLDENGFSTIKSLTIEYNWLTMLIHDNASKITIEGLNLTGGIDRNQNLQISGWNQNAIGNMLEQLFKTEEIVFKNAQLSLLSETSGGISITANGEIEKNEIGSTFHGTLSNTQKNMRYSARFDGQLNKDLTWNSDIKIEDIRLDMEHIKATRASGAIKASKERNKRSNITGEIYAGNMIITGFPWKSASISLQGEPKAPNVIIAAKAPQHESIELGLAMPNIYDTQALSGYIYTGEVTELLDYIEQNTTLPIEREALTPLENWHDVEVNYEKNGLDLEFRINAPTLGTTFEGFTRLHPNETEGRTMLPAIALRNANPGHLSIKNEEFFNFVNLDGKNKVMLKKALQDFNYETLIIQIKPQTATDFEYEVDINGRSPNLQDNRPFTTKFTMNAPLGKIINRLANKSE